MVIGGIGSINATRINAATINGPGRLGRHEGEFEIVIASSVSSIATYIARPNALLDCQCELTVGANVNFVASCLINSGAELVCVEPKMRHASAVFIISGGGLSIDGLITQYGNVECESLAEFSVDSYMVCAASCDVDVAANLNCEPYQILQPLVDLDCMALADVSAIRYAMCEAAFDCRASANVLAGYSIAGEASFDIKCNMSASAGYGIPSLTVLTCQANMYARAVQFVQSSVGIASSAEMSVTAIAGFGGESVFDCSCLMTCTAVAVQGEVDGMGGTAELVANAEYWHMAHSESNTGAASLDLYPIMIHAGSFNSVCSSDGRIETKVNNIVEAFADFDTASTMGFNVNGVAVARFISHIHAYADMLTSADYRHMAMVSFDNAAEFSVDGTIMAMGEFEIESSAGMQAEAHFRWDAKCESVVTTSISVFANILHEIGKEFLEPINCSCDMAATPRYFINAQVDSVCVAELNADCLITRYATLATDPVQCIMTAYAIGNILAEDSLERTMYRPFVDRCMARPFVDRDMKTLSA